MGVQILKEGILEELLYKDGSYESKAKGSGVIHSQSLCFWVVKLCTFIIAEACTGFYVWGRDLVRYLKKEFGHGLEKMTF